MYLIFESPEIHPVSARRKPLSIGARIQERFSGCFKRKKSKIEPKKVKQTKQTQNNIINKKTKPSFVFKICPCIKKKSSVEKVSSKPPEIQRVNETKKPDGKFVSKLKSCCCFCNKRKNNKITTTTEKPKPKFSRGYKKKWWKRIICWDKICCCCSKKSIDVDKTGTESTKRKDKPRRASNDSGFPKLDPTLVDQTSIMRAAIPVLPVCLAWFCLITNVFLPGIGTILSGSFCLCFGKPRFSVNDSWLSRLGSFCVNFMVGLSQIFTILFCLVGWGWSIWWGVIMLRFAKKHRRIKLADKNGAEPAPVVDQNHDVEQGS